MSGLYGESSFCPSCIDHFWNKGDRKSIIENGICLFCKGQRDKEMSDKGNDPRVSASTSTGEPVVPRLS